jgi:uncharacterized protein YukE
MIPVSDAGGGGGPTGSPKGWKADPSLASWTPSSDPTASNTEIQPRWVQSIRELLGTNAGAFGQIDAQLRSTAQLAEFTASELNGAKAASWQGNAGNQYRATLSRLPADLNTVSDTYRQASSVLVDFAETSLRLKAQYERFQEQLAGLKRQLAWAVQQTYTSKDVGMAAINKIRNEMTDACTAALQILRNSMSAQDDFNGTFKPLIHAAPHEGTLTEILTPLRDLWHAMTGTLAAIWGFITHPSWANLANMSTDLAVDAGTLAMVAGFPEGLAGLGAIDTDSSAVAIGRALADGAEGAEGAAGVGATIGDIGDGNYAAAVFAGWGISKGVDSDIDDALTDAQVLNRWSADLEADPSQLPNLSKADLAALKELVPHYTDPAKVAQAAAEADSNLAQAALIKNPGKFIQGHFIVDPAEGAVAKAIDGKGSGS